MGCEVYRPPVSPSRLHGRNLLIPAGIGLIAGLAWPVAPQSADASETSELALTPVSEIDLREPVLDLRSTDEATPVAARRPRPLRPRTPPG